MKTRIFNLSHLFFLSLCLTVLSSCKDKKAINRYIENQQFDNAKAYLDSLFTVESNEYKRKSRGGLFIDVEMVHRNFYDRLFFFASNYDRCGEWTKAGNLLYQSEQIRAKYKFQPYSSETSTEGNHSYFFIAMYLRAERFDDARRHLSIVNKEMMNYYRGEYNLEISNFPPYSLSRVVYYNILCNNYNEALKILDKAEKFYHFNYGVLSNSKSITGAYLNGILKAGRVLGFDYMLEVYRQRALVYFHLNLTAKYEEQRYKEYEYTNMHFPHPQELAWNNLRYLVDLSNMGKNTFASRRYPMARTRLDTTVTIYKQDVNYWDQAEGAMLMAKAVRGEDIKYEKVDSLLNNALKVVESHNHFASDVPKVLILQLEWQLFNKKFNQADSTLNKILGRFSKNINYIDYSTFQYYHYHNYIALPSIYCRLKGEHQKADSILNFSSKFALVDPLDKYKHNTLRLEHEMLKKDYTAAQKYGKPILEYLGDKIPFVVEPFNLTNTTDILLSYEYYISEYLTALIEGGGPVEEVDKVIKIYDNVLNTVTEEYYAEIRGNSYQMDSLRKTYEDYYWNVTNFLNNQRDDDFPVSDSLFSNVYEEYLYELTFVMNQNQNMVLDKFKKEDKKTTNNSIVINGATNTNFKMGGGPSSDNGASKTNSEKAVVRNIAFLKTKKITGYLEHVPIYVAVIYDNDKPIKYHHWTNVSEIDSLIQSLNFAMSKGKDCKSCREKLSKILVVPILSEVTTASSIGIKNDGELNFLNWNLLANPNNTKENLVDSWNISIHNNTKFVKNNISGNSIKNCLLIGDVKFHTFKDGKMTLEDFKEIIGYNSTPSSPENKQGQGDNITLNESPESLISGHRGIFGKDGINELPHTKKEIEDISASIGKKRKILSLTGKDVTEYKIGELSKNYDVIHFATHGTYATNHEDLKDLYGWKEIRSYVQDDPMLTSALLLSGSGDHIYSRHKPEFVNDGILSALEIMNLNLSQSKLVVLSACETGQGQTISGQGVMGLQRAFFVAGAESIIVSYWEINDKFASVFMDEFYENWLTKGMSLDQAFIETRKGFMKKDSIWNKPHFWGSFSLIHR